MGRLLVLVTVAVALGIIAILASSPSIGRANDQRTADLAAETLMVDDVGTPAMPSGALQAEPTGPFRRAAVKADFVKETVGSVGNAATTDPGRTSAVEFSTRGDRPGGEQADVGRVAGNEVAMACALESHVGRGQTDRYTFMPAPSATNPTSELPVHARRADAEGVVSPSDLPPESPSSQAITGGQQPAASPSSPTEFDGSCALQCRLSCLNQPSLQPKRSRDRSPLT